MKLRINSVSMWDKGKILKNFNKKKLPNDTEKEEKLAKLLNLIKFTGEKDNDTFIRVMENYLGLISLVKIYKLMIKDAKYWRTTTRFEQCFGHASYKVDYQNKQYLIDLDEAMQKEMPKKFGGKEERVIFQNLKRRAFAVLELDKLLVLLEGLNYDDIVNQLVAAKVINNDSTNQLDPDTPFGTIALQIFHATLTLLEQSIREYVGKEEEYCPPQNMGQLFDRLNKKFEELDIHL